MTIGDESDGQGDLRRGNFGLGQAEAHLDRGAGPYTDQNRVSVDPGGGRGIVNGKHESGANDDKDSRERVPGHVEAMFGKDDAVDDTEDDDEDDEGKQSNTSLQRMIASRKLKVKGQEVDADEESSGHAAGLDVENDHLVGLEEVDGEDSVSFVGEDAIILLKAKGGEE